MRHGGRVEQRRAFQRVFAGEERADEQAARAVGHAVGDGKLGDPLVIAFQEVLGARVASGELLHDAVQALGGLGVGERHHAADDLGDARLVARDERAQQHPGAVRRELDPGALDLGNGGCRHGQRKSAAGGKESEVGAVPERERLNTARAVPAGKELFGEIHDGHRHAYPVPLLLTSPA